MAYSYCVAALVFFAALATLPRISQGADTASGFPSRPIMVIVPFSAGGPTDTLIRVLKRTHKFVPRSALDN